MKIKSKLDNSEVTEAKLDECLNKIFHLAHTCFNDDEASAFVLNILDEVLGVFTFMYTYDYALIGMCLLEIKEIVKAYCKSQPSFEGEIIYLTNFYNGR